MKHVLLLIATFFNIGRIKLAPGTWTSLATMLLVFYIPAYWKAPLYVQLIAIGVVFLIGIPAARYSEKHFETEDPSQCVIDEVAGQMVALLLVPHQIKFYFLSFLLFRFFDIFKPFPIKKLEHIPYGVGIMVDDIAAGLYALGLFHLLRYIF
ncbi:MAG: phosphatidylglycerophosphatase A [bacterium]|nr:phosphatidylglycerophosphatase A [bacterium]